jgi:hypothetical protein
MATPRRSGGKSWAGSRGCPGVRRLLIAIALLAAAGALVWSFVGHLESGSSRRGEPSAIILRAPDGFEVEELNETSFADAAGALARAAAARAGVRFADHGDLVILLADRPAGRVVELRASATGTIVERSWEQEVDRRLAWAAEHGTLDAPGLPPPTGKNLYH